MIKCLNCGKINPNEAKLCSKCGKHIINSSNVNRNIMSKQKQNTKIKKISLGLIGVLVFLMILGIVAGTSSSIDLTDLEVPDSLSIDSRNETQIVLHDYGYNDEDPIYMITITSEDQKTPEKLSNGFKENGYNLQSSNDIKINNMDVTEETFIYKNNYGHVYNYILKFGNKKYSISCLTDSENWNINNNNNPVNKIINSMISSSSDNNLKNNNSIPSRMNKTWDEILTSNDTSY